MSHTSRFAAAVVFVIAAVGQSAAQCTVHTTDVTMAGLGPAYPPRYLELRVTATGPGPNTRVGAFLPGTLFGSTQTCLGSTVCETTFYAACLTDGDHHVETWCASDAQTSGPFAERAIYTLSFTWVPPQFKITHFERLGPNLYQVQTEGQASAGCVYGGGGGFYELLRASGETFAPPVRYPSGATLPASPGDKVRAYWQPCTNNPERIVTAEAIIPKPLSVEVAVEDGDAQRAVVGEAAEKPLKVKFTASDPSFALSGITAVFEIVSVPAGAIGHGVGASIAATSATYSVPVGNDGTASAIIVAGSLPGPYVVRVKSPLSATGTEAKFTTTAIKPVSVVVLKDTTNLSERAYTYVASGTEPALFHAVALDAVGAKIGPIRCAWSTSATGNPSTRGAGSLNPSAGTAATTFQPTKVGKLKLTATPGIKGVSSGVAELFLTSLYVSVQNDFVPANPVDDSPRFVPGMYLDGTNVALDVMKSTGQFISLHVLTGGVKGKATFTVDSTNYPGIAMNYPLDGDSTEDMMFTNGQQSITVDLDANTGDTWTTLLVRDYGASGTIRVAIESGKQAYTLAGRLPVDADGNGLPDAGWTAIGHVQIASAGLVATGDADAASGASGVEPAVIGDGLSSFEEFRGFIVAGGYVRLDPRAKQIFVDIDPEFLLGSSVASPVQALTTLNARILYLEPGETKGDDQLSRNLLRTRGAVDFNRAGVPVAHNRPQRAVRLVYQNAFPPAVHLAGPNIDVPVWQIGFLGATFSDDVLDRDVLNAPGNVATTETPMRTQFSEVYSRTFTNLAINTTFTYPLHYDASGSVVPQCAFQSEAGCDVWDMTNLLIVPSLQDGTWGILYTVPDPGHDAVEHYSVQARRCVDGSPVVGGLTTIEMERLKCLIAVHEIGHALRMDHLKNSSSDCGDLMFDNEGPATQRRTMSNSLPQPSGFSAADESMMRLWQP